jgi:hypothetical protein
MFANLYVNEPLEKIAEDWDFLHEKVIGHFSTFKPWGQNIYGIRRRAISESEVNDPRKGAISQHFEITPRGLVEWKHQAFKLHVTLSGTPHRVIHNFGYWHINDMDELYLPLPGPTPDELGYFLVIMGHPTGAESDRFAWYCQKCLTLMFEFQYETGRLGFPGFWKAERVAVKAYNADPKNQLCPECGHVNPQGYCWSPAKDTPSEQEARKIW